MIDILLQVFGPSLAKKLFPQGNDLTLQNLAEVSQDLAAAFAASSQVVAKQEEAITEIQKELLGLTPVNVNFQFEEIYKWMKDHVESEERTFRELAYQQREMARKQRIWHISLACGIAVALILAMMSLLK